MNTLKHLSTAELTVNKSKFIGISYPIQSKKEFEAQLLEIKKRHPKANHHCTAFIINEISGEYHLVNDDGEPRNSAGMPILRQLQSHSLMNCAIVVVRYFGGIKLGVGGLIKAYRSAAKLALNENKIIPFLDMAKLKINVEYAQLGDLLGHFDKLNLKYKVKQGVNQVTVFFNYPKDLEGIIMPKIKRFTTNQ